MELLEQIKDVKNKTRRSRVTENNADVAPSVEENPSPKPSLVQKLMPADHK